MRRRSAQWCIAFVCLLLGLGLVTQLRTYHTAAKAGLAPADQAVVIGNLVESNLELRREVSDLEHRLDLYSQTEGAASVDAMLRDLAQLRLATGTTRTSGPGVEVTVGGNIRAEELGDLLNELRNAGAEAVAVNDVRLGTRSIFQQSPNGYRVNGVDVSAPLRFTAVGMPATLETALLRKGGVVSLLRSYYTSTEIEVTRRELIILPAVEQSMATYSLARPARS
jgi:uncharacterized protein YlxW (UPF0749 family)